jgi:hypothetical protein
MNNHRFGRGRCRAEKKAGDKKKEARAHAAGSLEVAASMLRAARLWQEKSPNRGGGSGFLVGAAG